MKGLIVFKGKYGATSQYAGWLGIELGLPVVEEDRPEGSTLGKFDYLVLGSSVYIGKLQLKDWLIRNIRILQQKKIFLFIVCGTGPEEKEELEKIARDNIPEEIRNRISVFFLQGRKIQKKLSRIDRFKLKLGAILTRNPKARKLMQQDFDHVKKENLIPLINSVSAFNRQEKDLSIHFGTVM